MDLDVLMDQADAVASNVNGLTDEVKKLTARLYDTVDANQDEISRIIANLESTSENVKELTEDIKQNPWKLLHRPRERKTR